MADPRLIESTGEFLQVVEKSGLLEAARLEQLRSASQGVDPIKLARQLIRDGDLTKWQAGQLLLGFHRLTIGNYKLCDEAGKGELGRVFLAEHAKLGKRVAVKTLAPQHTDSPELVQRFLGEAQAAATLDHRNVVHVHDFNRDGDRHYVVMEYVDGKDLKKRVAESGPLPIPEAIDYLRQAATGLEYIHSQGVTHRNLKPANLLVDHQGVLKILDTGVGQLRSDQEGEPSGAALMSMLSYRSPEQVRSKPLDARSDIYSLGGVLYYLLTARAAFSADDEKQVQRIKQTRKPIPVCELRDDVPPELAAICERMMAFAPQERFASCAQLLEQLELIAAPQSQPQPQPTQPAEQPARPQGKQPAAAEPRKGVAAVPRGLLIGGAAAAAVLLIVSVTAVALLMSSGQPQEVAQQPSPAAEQSPSPSLTGAVAPVNLDEIPNPEVTLVPADEQPAAPQAVEAQDAATPQAAEAAAEGAATGRVPAAVTATPQPSPPERDAAPQPATPASTAPQPAAASPEPPSGLPVNPDTPVTPAAQPAAPAAPEADQKKKAAVPAKKKAPPRKTFELAEAVNLPDVAEQSLAPAVLGRIDIDADAACYIELAGGEKAVRGKQTFVIRNAQSGTAPRDWELMLLDAAATEALVARLALQENELRFQWSEQAAEVPSATNLRNCTLKITAGQGQLHALALRTPHHEPPVVVELDKAVATARLNVDAAPDADSMSVATEVEGQAITLEPPDAIPASKGTQWVIFGEDKEQAVLRVRVETSATTRGVQLKLEPYFTLPIVPEPIKMTRANLNRFGNLQQQRLLADGRIAQMQKASKEKKNKTPQEEAFIRQQIEQFQKDMAALDAAVARMQALEQLYEALGGSVQFRFQVAYESLDGRLLLLVTDAPAEE